MNLEIEPQIPINLIQNNHFLQMSKDKQLSELELAKKEIDSLKRKNEELQTENSKIPKLFEDYKLQDETFLKSVQRRLSYQHQHAKKPHDILTTYSGIIKEIDPKIFKSGTITEDLIKNYFIGFLTVMIRKSFMNDELKNFDSKYNMLSDFDYILRFSMKYKIDYIKDILAVYNQHENQLQLKNIRF